MDHAPSLDQTEQRPKAAIHKSVLTANGVKALKPAERPYTMWDAKVPGFGVTVSPKGAKSFIVFRRLLLGRESGKQSKVVYHTLGRVSEILGQGMTLLEARRAALVALRDLEEGRHPAAAKKAQQRAKQEADALADDRAFSIVAEAYIKKHLSTLRDAKASESLIHQRLIPRWGTRPITEITRRDIRDMIDEAKVVKPRRKGKALGGSYAARNALRTARHLFNWALARDDYGLVANPCAGIKEASEISGIADRERVLADEELAIVWRAAEKIGAPYGTIIQLLALTGQRLTEIAFARWSEIDLANGVLTIPRARYKTNTTHSVPLTPTAVRLIEAMPRFEPSSNTGDYVFTTTNGRRPFSGFSKAKTLLDTVHIAAVIAEDRAAGAIELRDVEPWRVHDLRRTVRSGLSALKVSPLICELVIGHQQQGVLKIYDRYRYADEKREALALWEKRLLNIVNPTPRDGNVTDLAVARAERATAG